jgi:phospholipid transport system transporter-binding protein
VSNLTIIEQSPQYYRVEGNLTFSSITTKTVNSFRLATGMRIIIDLKQVITTDSAGLALIIEWISLAKRNNVDLQFQNIPNQLLALAKLSDLEQIIQISEQNGTIAIASQEPK